MIAKLTGEVVDVRLTHIVVQVGGIGYLVAVAKGSGYFLGTQVELHTHLAVRETALDLYGFNTRDDLSMFEHLIKLPKIGPKTAIQILSQADLETLKQAIRTHDPAYLSKMSGLSKKSAEKIVSGLVDIFEGDGYVNTGDSTNQSDSDVIDALITLGYSQRDALQAIQKIPADITDINARIKHALKYVGE